MAQAVRTLTAAGKALRRGVEAVKGKSRHPAMVIAGKQPTKPTEKDVKKAKELRKALESGRAEAKPGAELLDLGPPLRGLDIIVPSHRQVRRTEIQAANEAIKKSLRESKGRRAKAKEKGRVYKRSRTPRPAHRTGGR